MQTNDSFEQGFVAQRWKKVHIQQNIQMVEDIFKLQLHQVFYILISFIWPATELGVNYWE